MCPFIGERGDSANLTGRLHRLCTNQFRKQKLQCETLIHQILLVDCY